MAEDWLHGRAKAMRREPALFEKRLRALLRDRRLESLKFRRQMVIGGYIADFVCLRHRLIVETDGPQHEDRILHDAERDAALTSEGFRVLRFENRQVENQGHEVIATILTAANASVILD